MKSKNIFLKSLLAVFVLFFALHSFAQTCGDGSCDPGENSCTCAADCGSCEGDVPGKTCKQYTCQEDICSIVSVANCCGNDLCEESESYGNCPADCTPKNIEIEVLSPTEQRFARGEEVLLKVKITADERAISSPTVLATGFFGELNFFNDGKHDDDRTGDNVFANTFSIPTELEAGPQTIEVKAEFLGISSTQQIELEIDPTLEIQTEIEDELELGQNLEISGQVLKKGNKTTADFEIKLFIGQQEVLFESARTDEEGTFKTAYHSSLLDSVGNWKLTISATDGFGNSSSFEKTISAKKPESIEPLNIEITKNFEKSYSQGESIDFIIQLVNDEQELVKDAKVFLNLPNEEQLSLVEVEPGKYARSIKVSREFKEGFNSFEIEARAVVNNVQAKATQQIVVKIKSFDLKIEIIEPSNLNYEIGENMELKIKVTDFEGEPVNDATVKALINNIEVSFELAKIGTYSTVYEIQPSDEGEIKIEFSAVDSFENQGLKSMNVSVGGKAFFYDIFQNILVFAAVIIVILLVGTGALIFVRSKKSEKSLEKKINELEGMQKQTQEKYFHEHAISKKEYQEIMEKYESELKKAKNELQELKQKK